MSLDVYLEMDQPSHLTKVRIVYQANITHNLGKMADVAGIYYALWRPEEIGAVKAKDITELLRSGLEKLRKEPEVYKVHNSSNGWGNYDNFVSFVQKYLEACEKYPEATIWVSR